MRFDDSLRTVLASDAATGFGAQATWRQLVDLIGRGRTPAAPATMAQLRNLRDEVPAATRAASARALAFASPPASLVALFADDELAIAAPVLRTATLDADEWLALLPALTPRGRSVLRHRRDLPDAAVRGLESFGAVDFLLGHDGEDQADAPVIADPSPIVAASGADPAPEPEPEVAREPAPLPEPVAAAPLSDTPFQPVAEVARGIPVVAEALRLRDAQPAEPAESEPTLPGIADPEPAGRFEIADLVARIDAFRRERPDPAALPAAAAEPEEFAFETDAAGTIRWVEGAPRAALVGISLAHSAPQGLARIDGLAAGAFRGRARFADARLRIDGASAAAGDWRLAAEPRFDHASGRFVGYRGHARRPRPDEIAGPRNGLGDTARAASDSLRQLVHELRTPTNAIAGFAELIETQLLGPVAPPYREQAAAIRSHTMALIGAIDDLDTAARIAGHALELRPAEVVLEPMIARVLTDLAPLARLRGAGIAFNPAGEHQVRADGHAVERLLGRLLAALVSASANGERLRLKVKAKGDGSVAIHVDRPAALATVGDALDESTALAIDADRDPPEGAPLLGTGFTLRLARNLAAELGGGLVIGADRLTLRLPAALDREVGRAAE